MAPSHLFVLAPPRSFTSVTCAMLGQHPQMYSLPEVHLFVAGTYNELLKLYQIRRGFQHGLLRAIAELGLGAQTEANVVAARQWLEELGDTDTATLYQDLAEWASPRALVDKSPTYVYKSESLERIAASVPGAYYLHLTRHPRAMCESVYTLRRDIKERLANFIPDSRSRAGIENRHNRLAKHDDPETIWLKPHRNIMNFLEKVPSGHKMRIRGEDLLADTDKHLKEIADWLGIRSDDESLEAMKHPEQSPFAKFGPSNARFGNDPGFLANPKLRPFVPKPLELEDIVGDDFNHSMSAEIKELAAEFGY